MPTYGSISNIISIHAPTRGATPLGSFLDTLFSLFQSTLPREERRKAYYVGTVVKNFNPRSHERSDGVFTCYCA